MNSNTHEDESALVVESPGVLLQSELRAPVSLPALLFLDNARRRGWLHMVRQPLFVRELAPDVVNEMGMVEAHHASGNSHDWLLRVGEALLWLDASFGSVNATIAAATTEAAEAVRDRLVGLFGAWTPPDDEVAMTFWAHGCSAPTAMRRRITAPAWADLRRSYSGEVVAGMRQLLAARESAPGRLILWHGPPGTGKTYALRSLLRGWQEWCVPHFVTDPDVLLGGDSAYMMQVLTAGDWEPGKNRTWTLVVLEDAGELLAIDARRETGQALSRLLNITDGLLGQGVNALVLVTTNEPLSTLHPAVSRPGRCWMEIEFGPLGRRQASAWLRAHGSEVRVKTPTVLADLYALLSGRNGGGPEPALSIEHHAIGFAQSLAST